MSVSNVYVYSPEASKSLPDESEFWFHTYTYLDHTFRGNHFSLLYYTYCTVHYYNQYQLTTTATNKI